MPLQPCSALGTVGLQSGVWGVGGCPQAAPGFSTAGGYLLARRTRCYPRGIGEARSVPPLPRVWSLFPIGLGAQGFVPAPAFVPFSAAQSSPFGGPRPHQTQPLDSHFLPLKKEGS